MFEFTTSLCMFAAVGAMHLWYAVPLIASISLVYSATRHEQMGPILIHAFKFAVWIVVFMLAVLVVLQIMSWLI